MRPFILTVLFILCQVFSSIAQDEKLFSPKKLTADYKRFEKFLEAHPDPYTHIKEEDFKEKLSELKKSLDRPHTFREFYKKLSAMVALIKDGHSIVHFPRHWWEKKLKHNGCFPYEVFLTNENQLYVIKKYTEDPIPIGAKILSINGITVDSFIRHIDPYISYELPRFRNTVIDNLINKYLYLVFGDRDQHDIQFFHADTGACLVKNMPYKEWIKYHKDDRDEREEQISKGRPFLFEKVGDGIGLLHVYAFWAKDLTTYNLFLEKTFKEIRKENIHSLIIDIRGNFGGWPKLESELLHYLSNLHFKTSALSSMKVSYPYREYFEEMIPGLRRYTKHYLNDRHSLNLDAIMSNTINSFVIEDDLYNEKPRFEEYEFYGDCYLLTNRDSYSAASSFASTFQCYQMGTIIGEETGGTKIFRANAIPEQLYHSGITINISTTKIFTACYNDELEGVMPNIEYTPSILELISGRDIQLAFTLRVIDKIQKARQN